MVYGYCRISRKSQNIQRQVRNILSEYPDAKIYQETFTGTKIYGRQEFHKLLKVAASGDVIVFDSVSRMSRNADEGVELYFALYNKGVQLVFLKERYIDTAVYQRNSEKKIELTGTDEDALFNGINQYFAKLAERQIRIAFEQAQKEVDDLHQRTKEGIETARQEGKQIGQKKGAKLNVKKKEPMKEKIMKKSRDFQGYMTDKDLIVVLGIARNTFYKYKKELLQELRSKS